MPADGVGAVPKTPRQGVKEQPGGERAAFTSALFTRKGEYAQTLDALDRFLTGGLAEAERATELDGVEKLGAAGRSAFKGLGEEVEADRLLLGVEREELVAAVRERAAAWKAQVERAARFAGVEIEPAFRPHLTGNPLLMETTGAKVVELPDGRRVVLRRGLDGAEGRGGGRPTAGRAGLPGEGAGRRRRRAGGGAGGPHRGRRRSAPPRPPTRRASGRRACPSTSR